MEDLGVGLFGDVYRGQRVLVTGHTGFKGSWLCLFLHMLGADVSGLSLAPEDPSHYSQIGLSVAGEFHDIRGSDVVTDVVLAYRPHFVFHLAAQPLVRQGYHTPDVTWDTNVMGTLHVLEAVRRCPETRAVVCVTTDKVYENLERGLAFDETSRLGGDDPYSASKAAMELLVHSHRESFFSGDDAPLVATARAGNVIGGGDWAANRLIPDLVRSLADRRIAAVRNPGSVRPWQHVLDCVAAYLHIGRHLFQGDTSSARSWNIGPPPADQLTVAEVVERFAQALSSLEWSVEPDAGPKEAGHLTLDAGLISRQLGWQPVWTADEAITRTASWYESFLRDSRVQSTDDITAFVDSATQLESRWIA